MPSYLRALTELFDASVADIVDAAQPLTFDREGIRLAADIWHNNILNMYAAVMASTRRGQEVRARETLERMVTLRPGHRDWYRRLGVPMEILSGIPARESNGPWRDYLGHVMHPEVEMTSASVIELGADYDVAGTTLSRVAVDHRRGSTDAVVSFDAQRRFTVANVSERAPRIRVRLKGVREVSFDSREVIGIELHAEPEVVIAAGAGTRIRAGRAKVWIDDRQWHWSAAGHRSDLTAPTGVRPPDAGRGRGHELSEDVMAVARQVYHAMLQIRVVGGSPTYGYSELALLHARPLSGLGGALAACTEVPSSRRQVKVLAVSEPAIATVKSVAPPTYADVDSTVLRHLGWSLESGRDGADRFNVVEAVEDPAAGWVTRPREWETASRVQFTAKSYEVE